MKRTCPVTLLLIACCLWIFTPAGMAVEKEANTEQVAQKTETAWEQTIHSAERISENAEAMSKHAVDIAKDWKGNQKDLQEKMQSIQKHIQDILPDVHQTVQRSLALANDFQLDLKLDDMNIDLSGLDNLAIPDMPKFSEFDMNFDGEIVTNTLQKQFTVDAETPLHVHTTFSSIAIEPGKVSDQIEITVDIKAGADTEEEAQRILERYNVSIDKTSQGVELNIQLDKEKDRNRQKPNKRTMMHCKAVVRVPAKTPIELSNSFGDVLIQKIQGDITLRNSFGNIILKDMNAPLLDCENKFGRTRIDDSQGQLEIKSEHGPLDIIDFSGPSKIRGPFSNINLVRFSGDIDIEAGFGTTRIFHLSNEAHIKGNFNFGKAEIYLPEDYTGKIEAFTNFAGIQAPDSLIREKKMFKESVEGHFGSGSGHVKINGQHTPLSIQLHAPEIGEETRSTRKVSQTIIKTLHDIVEDANKPQVSCSGLVLNDTGDPIAGATVEAFYSDKEPYAITTTNEDGEYRIKVYAEEHFIKASAPGYRMNDSQNRIIKTGALQQKKRLKINFVLQPE